MTKSTTIKYNTLLVESLQVFCLLERFILLPGDKVLDKWYPNGYNKERSHK